MEERKNEFYKFTGKVSEMTFNQLWEGVKHNVKVSMKESAKNTGERFDKETYARMLRSLKPTAKALWDLHKRDRSICQFSF